MSVLCAAPPDPAPPGVADFATGAFAAWRSRHDAFVSYDPVAWPQLFRRLETYFDAESRVYDLMYLAHWIPEFHDSLDPISGELPGGVVADMPDSSWNACRWSGETLGCPTTLSLLTLFVNAGHLAESGVPAAPATWEQLKEAASDLTRPGRSGWVSNYGVPGGIGGTASYWLAFLQQAGGGMYGEDGLPAFNDEAGIAALQLMVDLMPSTHASVMTNTGIVDATNVFAAGEASMMLNWPFMWQAVQESLSFAGAGSVSTALLPAGSAGTASIDGGETWAIPRRNWNRDLGFDLLQFYLEKPVQRMQAIATGWLPIRLSVLQEAEVQEALPYAATLLEQAQHPYDSFLTPDYETVTGAIGAEIQHAIAGEKTAQEAMADASEAVTAIVQSRK